MKFLKNSVTKGIVFLFLMGNIITAQTVTYESVPSDYQLYPRDESADDSAVVTIYGVIDGGAYDSVIVDIYSNDVYWRSRGVELTYSAGVATFLLEPKIHAELTEYKFDIRMGPADNVERDRLVDNVVCGDVYLINGQSNAEASAQWGGFTSYQVEWVRTFGTSNQDDTELDVTWDLGQADDIRTHAAIGIWALRLGELIANTYGIPVCFINGALGGQAIYKFRKGQGYDIYEHLLWRAQMAGVVDNVKAMIWNQGENNTKDNGATNEYNSIFPILRTDWRADFAGIGKIYTAQIHVGWDYSDWVFGRKLREFQRQLAEGDADTEIMTMHNLPGFNGQHYMAFGYDSLAFRLFRQIRRDFYGSSDVVDIDPPNISKAYFTDEQKDVLVLEFDSTSTLIWQGDSIVNSVTRYLKDYFYLFKDATTADVAIVDAGQVFGNLLRLELNTSSSATLITYLPKRYYDDSTSYVGPWLKSSREIPALSFHQFPIDPLPGDDPLPVTLSTFSASFQEGAIKLKWRTESEVNNLGFILLRKSAGEHEYQEIASYEYEPGLKGQGNTSQATDYEFIDSRITEGQTYNYLLMDVDYSGNKTRHGPITITATAEGSSPQGYNLYQNYPNPFNPTTNIAFFLPQQQHVQLRVLDILGKEVEVLLDNHVPAGYHEVPFEASNLRSGHYFYELRTAEYRDTKKMLLIR